MSSKIKVDNIENQCGGAVVTKCGATTTISGSVVKADDIQAADGGNLINQCGTTITLGASGDTINLASGASQSGFGRTGTVNWDTTAKTASFTAVNGNGYFVNTTSGAITVTMPASPSAGDIVGIKDYAGTFATNNVTINRNGSNFDGVGTNPTLSTNQLSVFFVYVDGTQGWKATQNDSGAYGALFITASGGTESTCGDYKIHTFTSPGTFCVSGVGNPLGSSTVDYLVIAGGGGGAAGNSPAHGGGGGGAGGYRESSGAASGCYTASPLGSGVSALPVSAQGYPITVGAGGNGSTSNDVVGSCGSNSIFSTITSTGGGGGGASLPSAPNFPGRPGGSGGGGSSEGSGSGGTGNTPPVSPPQGNNGGAGVNTSTPCLQTGGGGGATAVGTSGTGGGTMGAGGAGATSVISGSPTTRAGGGGGGATGPCTGAGGPGGSGGGGNGGTPGTPGGNGDTNKGSGGGGGKGGSPGQTNGGNGGSGVVVIRYKYQ